MSKFNTQKSIDWIMEVHAQGWLGLLDEDKYIKVLMQKMRKTVYETIVEILVKKTKMRDAINYFAIQNKNLYDVNMKKGAI